MSETLSDVLARLALDGLDLQDGAGALLDPQEALYTLPEPLLDLPARVREGALPDLMVGADPEVAMFVVIGARLSGSGMAGPHPIPPPGDRQ